MKNLIKLNVIFLAFIIIFSSKSLSAEFLMPLKKPTVNKEIKAKVESRKAIYPKKKPKISINKNLTSSESDDIIEKTITEDIASIIPKKKTKYN